MVGYVFLVLDATTFPIKEVTRGEVTKFELSGWGRDRTVDLTIFSRTLVPTELPSQKQLATQTGLEPATSAVTGRRANQLRYWANRTPSSEICAWLASPTGFEPVLPP